MQLAGGVALAAGKLPRFAGAALTSFLLTATIIGHPFWSAPDEKSRTKDESSFFVNIGLIGAVLFVAIVENKFGKKPAS